jgi:hypothetical protein
MSKILRAGIFTNRKTKFLYNNSFYFKSKVIGTNSIFKTKIARFHYTNDSNQYSDATHPLYYMNDLNNPLNPNSPNHPNNKNNSSDGDCVMIDPSNPLSPLSPLNPLNPASPLNTINTFDIKNFPNTIDNESENIIISNYDNHTFDSINGLDSGYSDSGSSSSDGGSGDGGSSGSCGD